MPSSVGAAEAAKADKANSRNKIGLELGSVAGPV